MDSDNLKFNEMNNFINKQKPWYNNWYCGITNDVKRRFDEHNVTAWYTSRTFSSSKVARNVEEIFIKKWCDWWNWWWDTDSIIVYAYIIKNDTVENG